jgi:hypothetical protein
MFQSPDKNAAQTFLFFYIRTVSQITDIEADIHACVHAAALLVLCLSHSGSVHQCSVLHQFNNSVTPQKGCYVVLTLGPHSLTELARQCCLHQKGYSRDHAGQGHRNPQ